MSTQAELQLQLPVAEEQEGEAAAPPAHGITAWARGLAGLLLLLGVGLMFANVVARQLFAAPFYWAEEVAVYLNIWCVFVGVALVTRGNAHLRMDLLLNALPRRPSRWLRAASWLGLVVASGVVTVCSATLLMQLWQADLRSVAVGVPMVVPHLAVFVGFGATCIVALACWRNYLGDAPRPEEEPAP